MNGIKLVVDTESSGERVDIFVSSYLENKSRSFVQGLIQKGYIQINSTLKKSNYRVKEKDEITIMLPEPIKLNVEPENIKLDIMYEDEDLIVVNKPQGMIVHPATGVYSGTLVNALLFHCKDLSGINGVLRPGIVHRIDKDTSGILVVAKNDFAHVKLSEQLKNHTMVREYEAITEGVLKQDDGIVDVPLARHPSERIKMAVVKDGRRAVTHYFVIQRFIENTYIRCRLETGRTHQIRVHMNYIGHPLVGDPVYGFKKQKYKLQGQVLHAKKLGFIHPTTGEYIEFNSPLPEYFSNLLINLRNQLK